MFSRKSLAAAGVRRRSRTTFAVAVALLGCALHGANVTAAAPIDAWLERALTHGEQQFFVVLDSRADVEGVARRLKSAPRVARTTAVRNALLEHAARSQAPLRAWLDARGIAYRSFHIVNAVLVRGDARLAAEIAARSDVLRIEGNPRLAVRLPRPAQRRELLRKALATIEPGIVATNAPALWAKGITGQGIVVGSQDTGVTWDHPALKNQYLGWDGTAAAHDYHWHDSIHAAPGQPVNPCGYDTPAPCDDVFHGTHTVGTAVGTDGGTNQIGMAPGARWIACRNMDQGVGTPETYIECFEWFLAPYPVGGTPAQGDPARAPHVTINSWTCPQSEGCSPDTLQAAVEAQRAAGIMTVVAAGNGGPACNTIDDPPGIYDAAYSIAAYDAATNALTDFSSRGPVTIDGSGRMKPDLAAPGFDVRSAMPVGYGVLSGTSMATPHVAGAVALLWSGLPGLKGDIDATEAALNAGAVPVPATDCNTTGTPNADWGYGKLDAAGAHAVVLSVAREGSGSGTVTSQPAGILCGGTCAAVLTPGSPVTLTATPDAGSVFVGWLGACTGSGPCALADGAGKSVTAGFAPATLQRSLDIDGNGHGDALTDGLMIVRFLLGLPAADIAAGAAAAVIDPSALFARLQNLRPLFDVDGNGSTEALTDGALLLRYLFGLRGAPLTSGALGAGAARDAGAIAGYLGPLLP